MTDNVINTANAPAPLGPYSQGRIANGPTLWVAGQVALDPKTSEFVKGPITDQARVAFQNLAAVVEAAGATLADVVKVNLYLSDIGNGGAVNEVYAEFFPEPRPARTTIQATLPANLEIEIDCVVELKR